MEILLDNPVFIAIIIGLISTLFSKFKDESKDQNRPGRPARPDRREPGQKPVWNGQTPKPRAESNASEAKAKPAMAKKLPPESGTRPSLKQADLQEDYQNKKAHSASVSPRMHSSAPKEALSEAENRKNRDEKAGITLKPEANRLIEGVVWAEVLGPPRAKRPHRPMVRR